MFLSLASPLAVLDISSSYIANFATDSSSVLISFSDLYPLSSLPSISFNPKNSIFFKFSPNLTVFSANFFW